MAIVSDVGIVAVLKARFRTLPPCRPPAVAANPILLSVPSLFVVPG